MDAPSIGMIPSGYKDGKLYSVYPLEGLGEELTVNGTFDTDSDWVKGPRWSISGGKAICSANGGFSSFRQTGVLTSGKIYKITLDFDGSGITSGSIKLNGADFSNASSAERTIVDGTNIFYVEATSSDFAINESGAVGTGIFDNISVKEDTSADFDFTRGSLATRVNAQGLVEDVNIISEELTQNGNFDEIGSEEITNGDFSQEGSELVVNGGFDTDSDWTKGTGWTISDGKANQDGSNGILRQFNVLSTNTKAKITFDLSNYGGSGGLQVKIAPNIYTITLTGDGSYTVFTDGTNSLNGDLQIITNGGFTGSVDNISVVEVGQDWIFSDGATITDNGVRIVSDGTYQRITQNNVLTAGKQYKVQYEIVENNSGELKMSSSFGLTPIPSTVGTHTVYAEALQTFLTIERFAACDITIDNVSVKEVGQNWSFVNGSEFTEQGARINNTVTGANANISQINSNFTQGKLIVFKYDVVATNGKRCVIEQIGDNIDLDTLTVGTNKKVYFVFDRADAKLIIKRAESSTDVTLDNVSVKEITDATDLPRLDYTGGGCPSLLLEPQSTNLITYSEDFSQWNANGDTVIESGYLAPDGTNSAYKILGGTSTLVYTSISNQTQTRTIWARTVSGTGQAHLCSFNGNTNNLFTITEQWQRFEVNGTTTSTGATSFYAIDFRGSTNLTEVILWGAQLEELPYATSYIPTNGSVQTRLKDQASRSGLQDHINSTEGVFYAEFSGLGNDSVNRIISLSDGSSSNRITIQYNSDNNFFQQVRSGGTAVAGKTTTISDITDNIKTAIKYKENDFAFWLNGVEIHTDTSGAAPTGLNRVGFDNGSGSNNFHGRVKDLRVYNTALSDEDLTSLTS